MWYPEISNQMISTIRHWESAVPNTWQLFQLIELIMLKHRYLHLTLQTCHPRLIIIWWSDLFLFQLVHPLIVFFSDDVKIKFVFPCNLPPGASKGIKNQFKRALKWHSPLSVRRPLCNMLAAGATIQHKTIFHFFVFQFLSSDSFNRFNSVRHQT